MLIVQIVAVLVLYLLILITKTLKNVLSVTVQANNKFSEQYEESEKVEKDNVYEYDKASGHLFCKYCGNNYLLKKHKKDCPALKCCPYCGKSTEREDGFCSANCKKFYLIG